MVDPSFDFETETRAEYRVRQRDDLYAHEVFRTPPLDGVLVSMGLVESMGGNTPGRYSIAQRHRLRRVGAREFFRLPPAEAGAPRIELMGDCGAFSYVREPEPPFTTEEVIDFYVDCGFDFGISVDHMILGFDADEESQLPGIDAVPPDWRNRQEITLSRAREFLAQCTTQKVSFTPIAVAHGWSPSSYASAFSELQKQGYGVIALGALVPLRTPAILSILESVSSVRKPETQIHLLGITRVQHVPEFASYGVTSFDSTSALRQAFKDERDNYHTMDRTYTAIHIPQVDANPKLARRIRSGEVDHDEARRLERECLAAVAGFDRGAGALEETLAVLRDYAALNDDSDSKVQLRVERYRESLEAAPWRECPCEICQKIGYHVILFRGTERNRRRGFHNVHVLYRKLRRTIEEMP